MAHKRNIACDALVREGNAAQQIAASVRQFQADRILLGTRSRSKMSKLLLGSVAEQVLRSVNLPVITVGPEAHLAVGSSGHKRSSCTPPHSERPLARARHLPARSRPASMRRLVLLHVLPPMDEMVRAGLPTGLESTAMHELRLLAAETGANEAGCCAQVEPRVVHGNPSIEILAASAELHASLSFLAPHSVQRCRISPVIAPFTGCWPMRAAPCSPCANRFKSPRQGEVEYLASRS